jgi:uncharacterized membrane protein
LQPEGQEGALAALYDALAELPQAIFVPIVGLLIEALGSYRVVFAFGVIMLAVALGLFGTKAGGREDELKSAARL